MPVGYTCAICGLVQEDDWSSVFRLPTQQEGSRLAAWLAVIHTVDPTFDQRVGKFGVCRKHFSGLRPSKDEQSANYAPSRYLMPLTSGVDAINSSESTAVKTLNAVPVLNMQADGVQNSAQHNKVDSNFDNRHYWCTYCLIWVKEPRRAKHCDTQFRCSFCDRWQPVTVVKNDSENSPSSSSTPDSIATSTDPFVDDPIEQEDATTVQCDQCLYETSFVSLIIHDDSITFKCSSCGAANEATELSSWQSETLRLIHTVEGSSVSPLTALQRPAYRSTKRTSFDLKNESSKRPTDLDEKRSRRQNTRHAVVDSFAGFHTTASSSSSTPVGLDNCSIPRFGRNSHQKRRKRAKYSSPYVA